MMEEAATETAPAPQVNGAQQEAPKIATQENEQNAMDNWLIAVLLCTIRGAISTLYRVDPAIVLVGCCRVLARAIGIMFVGDEIKVRQFRKLCLDAFKTTIFETPVQPYRPQPPTPTKKPSTSAASEGDGASESTSEKSEATPT